MKWLAASLVLLLCPFLSTGQTAFQNFETLGVDDGLTQNSVYGMYQDKRGFLWIGTADGLNRYDGKHIKRFKASLASEPFNANFIRGNIAEDKNENLWYYTENGLYSYNRSLNQIEKKYIPPQSALTRTDFKVVFVDALQRVWLFNPAYGLASYTIATGEFHPIPITRNKQITFFDRDATQCGENIWFGTGRYDGLYRFNTNTSHTDHFFAGEDVAFIQFKPGGYYKAGFDYIVSYDSGTKIAEHLPVKFPVTGIRSIREDSQHRLWVATYQEGLWLYDLVSKRAAIFQNEVFNKFSLPTNQLTGLLMDRCKNLWISTEGAGVCRTATKPTLFKSSVVSQQGSLRTNLFVKAIAEDATKKIWIASLQHPLYTLDPESGEIFAKEKIVQQGIVNAKAITFDSKKNIWIGHDEFISKLDSSGNLLARGEFKTPYQSGINKLLELKDGRILAATSAGLITISQQGKRLVAGNSLTGLWANDVTETDKELLWVGSRNNGVWLFTKKGNGYSQPTVFLDNLDVKSVHVDKQNDSLIWLATDQGFVRFNWHTKEKKFYNETNGMNSSFVYGILEDDRGRLWCSTNGGISCFDKSKKNFVNYTSKDGLQSNEFNSGAFHHGASGNLYFGGVKGLNWLKPEDLDADTVTAKIAITELNVGDAAMSDSIMQMGKLILPYFKNDISIRFSVFDFSKPEGNKVKYQLQGWDDKPQITFEQNAEYKNLTPGNYTLTFSASTSNNKWSKQQRFEFVIMPPFWQRWWFYSLVILSVTGLIGAIVWYTTRQRYKWRIAELEKQNALELERRRISMEMHDDIGAHLTQITLMSEAAKHKMEKETSLDQIAQTSRKVVHSMSEIIWSLNPDNKTFEQLMSYLRDQLHHLLEPSGIDYRIDLPESGDFVLSNAAKRNIILLMKEAVNNAVKHSHATEISVIGKFYSKIFEVEISDNGIGFELNNGFAGNGLKSMNSRVSEIKGEMKINSNKGGGTSVRFSISLN